VVRLSIVVPALSCTQRLEDTLISILSHRPPHSEVLVVLGQPYADPYQLSDEVRFVQAPSADWVSSVNAGIEASAAPIVNVITPGVEVGEGWTAAVPRHFRCPEVASVAPRLRMVGQIDRVYATGITYRRGGSRRLTGAGMSAGDPDITRQKPVGPTWLTGFYRKSAVKLIGGFDASVGDELADIDLALRLAYVGFRCVSEIHSEAVLTQLPADRRAPFRGACRAERLFWRALAAQPAAGSLVLHAAVILHELARNTVGGGAARGLLGRLVGVLDLPRCVRHRVELKRQRRQAAIALALDRNDRRRALRIDAPHTEPVKAHRVAPAPARRIAA
jgi:hypothetical protein